MARSSLTKNERGWLGDYRMDNWLKRSNYKKKADSYNATLDVFAAQTLKRNGEPDPVALKQLFSLVLENDRSFRGHVDRRPRRANKLRTSTGWRQVCTAAAGLAVDKYLRLDHDFEPATSLALTRDELRDRLSELAKLAAKRGEEADALVADDPGEERYDPPASARPNLEAIVLAQLETLLGQEMLILEPLDPASEVGVPENERDREVAKRALGRLKLGELRDIATQEGIDFDGTAEQLADRIAADKDDDAAEVAQLVLRYESETPERGLSTHLLPLRDAPALSAAARRLSSAENTYVRVGVARWFIIRKAKVAGGLLSLDGELRYYQVSPKHEYERFELTSRPGNAEVQIRARAGRPWVELDSQGSGDVRNLGLALERAAGLAPKPVLTLTAAATSGPMMGWDVRTAFMVAFMVLELSGPDATILNLRIIQFESTSAKAEQDARKPAVRSVRLGGQHLLSSRTACELIEAGRGIVSLQATVALRLTANDQVECPIRIDLLEGAASVFTGFTADAKTSETRQAHEYLIKRLSLALQSPDAAAKAPVKALAADIGKRAGEESPDTADIMAGPAPANGGASGAPGSSAQVPAAGSNT